MTAAVLIPGTLCDRRVFEPLTGHLNLEPHFAAPIEQTNVADAADAVLADAPERFVAVGFSLGGFVVLELLRRAPERLLGGVMIASNGHAIQPGAAAARRDEIARAERFGLDAVIDELWPRYVARSRQGRVDLKRIVRDMAGSVGVERFRTQAELAISRPDSASTIAATPIPMLALCGSEDSMVPPERSRSLDAARSARLVELVGVGHFISLEAPEAAATAINAWTTELALCC